MVHRGRLLLFLGILLALPVFLRSIFAQHCAVGTLECSSAFLPPPPGWILPAIILSIASLVASLFFYTSGLVERRREARLLREAGVRVNEDDLPLE